MIHSSWDTPRRAWMATTAPAVSFGVTKTVMFEHIHVPLMILVIVILWLKPFFLSSFVKKIQQQQQQQEAFEETSRPDVRRNDNFRRLRTNNQSTRWWIVICLRVRVYHVRGGCLGQCFLTALYAYCRSQKNAHLYMIRLDTKGQIAPVTVTVSAAAAIVKIVMDMTQKNRVRFWRWVKATNKHRT